MNRNKSIKTIIKDIIYSSKNYGIRCTFSLYVAKVFPYGGIHTEKFRYLINRQKHKEIFNFLDREFEPVITQYMIPCKIMVNPSKERFIWTFWWQGESEVPEIIKICLSSMRKYAGNYNVIVIDKYNYNQYIDIPNFILEKVYAGKIGLAHFSDVVRFLLLEKYGGVWLDSTILLTDFVPDELLGYDFYFGKLDREPINCVSEKRWNIQIMASKPHSAWSQYMCDMYMAYWKKYDKVFDYFYTDYFVYYGLNKCAPLREMFDKIPKENPLILQLDLNKEYSDNEYKKMTKNTYAFKTNRKQKYFCEIENNRKSFYGYFKEEYLPRV